MVIGEYNIPTCENCSNMKIVPTNHRIYQRKPGCGLIVNCSKSLLMAYHEYAESSPKYTKIAEECSMFDSMDAE